MLNEQLLRGPVICDFLAVSVPDNQCMWFLDDLERLMAGYGAFPDRTGSEPWDRTWRAPDGSEGTCKVKRFGAVVNVSASGAFLAGLRAAGLFENFLMSFAGYAHRLSRIDLAADFAVDGCLVLPWAEGLMLGGELSISRKRIDPKGIKYIRGLPAYPAPPDCHTGTLYSHKRRNIASVTACIYDKRHQYCENGYKDPGDWVRVELRMDKDVRATLRDAADPAPLFCHYASPGLLQRFRGVRLWEPHGMALSLPVRDLDPSEGLVRLVRFDPAIGRALRLASEIYGADAVDRLATLLAIRLEQCAAADLDQPSASAH